jgi:acyl-CoA thioesterase II
MPTEETDPDSPRPGPVTLSPLQVLLETLDLENIDRDLFRGRTPSTRRPRVFGGQVAGQALVAAQRTVPDRLVHSLHAYFLRLGQPELPIVYEVDRIRDGRSYTTRRVVGIQNGKAIFNLQASFQVDEKGYESQIAMPEGLADPETLPEWRPLFDADDERSQQGPSVPFDLREATPAGGYDRLLWLRTNGPLSDDPTLHRCVVAYASDLTLLSVAFEQHRPTMPRPSFIASLDHAMWFHRAFRIDEWMLYAQASTSTGGGRGLSRGELFTLDGRLAVSVVQEGALRP